MMMDTLTGRSGKLKLNGSAKVYSVYYLGHCDVMATASSSAAAAAAAAAEVRFATGGAVSELLDRADGRKAYMTVTQEGIKVHVMTAGASGGGENHLSTPERIAYYSCCSGDAAEAAPAHSRVFAWVEQVGRPASGPAPGQPQFVCHAAVFRRPDQAVEMVALTRHFLAACYRDWQLTRRWRQKKAADAAVVAASTSTEQQQQQQQQVTEASAALEAPAAQQPGGGSLENNLNK